MSDKRITVYTLRPKDRSFFKLEWVEPDTGRRKSKSARTADPDKAEKARADLEYELNHGLHQQPSKMPWDVFRQTYERRSLLAPEQPPARKRAMSSTSSRNWQGHEPSGR